MNVQSRPSDASLVHVRRLDLHVQVTEPAGMEVHRSGIFHEARSGDTVGDIAAEYSQSFEFDVSAKDLRAANAAALRDGLQAGELLVVPGLEDLVDTAVLRQHPRLREVNGQLRHIAKEGSTPDQIAQHYRATTGIRVTGDDILRANREVIPSSGALPGGIALRIPGVTGAAPRVSDRSLSALQGRTLLTLASRIDDGSETSTVDTMTYRADVQNAETLAGGGAKAAIALAEARLEDNTNPVRTYAVVQTSDGKYSAVPMSGRETGTGDDSPELTTRSLGMRAEGREVVAVVQRSSDGIVATRRFDR